MVVVFVVVVVLLVVDVAEKAGVMVSDRVRKVKMEDSCMVGVSRSLVLLNNSDLSANSATIREGS